MKALIATVAAGFIAGSLASAANAEASPSGDATMTEQISYADLDLGSAAGQHHLKNRISYAAYRLCLIEPVTATPSPAVADTKCHRKVMAEGLAQMQRAVARANGGPVLALARH